jgi:hypothetical protein
MLSSTVCGISMRQPNQMFEGGSVRPNPLPGQNIAAEKTETCAVFMPRMPPPLGDITDKCCGACDASKKMGRGTASTIQSPSSVKTSTSNRSAPCSSLSPFSSFAVTVNFALFPTVPVQSTPGSNASECLECSFLAETDGSHACMAQGSSLPVSRPSPFAVHCCAQAPRSVTRK